MKQNKVILSIVAIFFGLLVLGSCSAVTTYNGLVGEQTKVEQAQADVSTALQRRSDLIGNLVESVKGQMNHETEVFTKIADARAKIGSSSVTSELSGSENRIFVARKDYNKVAAEYNQKLRSFPTVLFANMMNFKEAETFKETEEAKTVPKVDFGTSSSSQ